MDTIAASREGDLLIATLSRPAQRNAMSGRLVAELIALLSEAETGGCRAIVLHGAGNGFCAGSDLAGLAAMDDAGRHAFELQSGRLARLLAACSIPVVAAVHGFAMGGGLTLAAACDIVVTTADARWSLPEVPVGLFPAWGIEAVVARVGAPAARRLCWGIDLWDGARSCAAGLADEVAEDALSEALAIARRLAALPAAQAAAVKSYFGVDPAVELRDHKAAALFLGATTSDAAVATFQRFARKP